MKHHRPYQLPPPAALAPRPSDAAILAREQAMIDAGTHPMLAERLARRAGENQTRRDHQPRFAVRPGDPF